MQEPEPRARPGLTLGAKVRVYPTGAFNLLDQGFASEPFEFLPSMLIEPPLKKYFWVSTFRAPVGRFLWSFDNLHIDV